MRSARRLGFALVFMIVLVTAGTLGGWFDVSDALNRVNINTIENDFGGETYMKVTTQDKVVSWTDYYDATITPTINEQKAYSYTEATDAENHVIEYTINFFTDESVDSVIKYYNDFYGETVMDTDSQGDVYLSGHKDGFRIWINIEKETDGTDVMVKATHESMIEE